MSSIPVIGGVVRAVTGMALGLSVHVVADAFAAWVAAGCAAVLGALGHAIDATTSPAIGPGFALEFDLVERIGALLALPFLLVASVQAVLRQDAAMLARAAFVRLPVALVCGPAALAAVRLGLAATDSLSAVMLSASSGRGDGLFVRLASEVQAGTGALGGFGALVLALVAGLVAFVLWIELAVRSAAVSVASLFIPLALSGLVWPATSHWARRLAETLGALVASKVVIAGVLGLAGSLLSGATGVSSLVDGVALLVLAASAPFAVLRLVPTVESAGALGLEGLARRGLRPVREAVGVAIEAVEPPGASGLPPDPDEIGYAPGISFAAPAPDDGGDAGGR